MKLVITIVQDNDAHPLLEKLVEKGYRATKLASTGGFLKKGNTTLLVGVEDEKVTEIVDLIKEKCSQTKQILPNISATGIPAESYLPQIIEVPVSGATIFVLDVEKYLKV